MKVPIYEEQPKLNTGNFPWSPAKVATFWEQIKCFAAITFQTVPELEAEGKGSTAYVKTKKNPCQY